MLILVTGQPGNGKSLRAMALVAEEYERNQQAVKAGKEQPRRFFSNIAGSTCDENPDAFPWMERLPEHNDWTQLPDGSFVLYDEAHADGKTPGLERYGHLFPSTGRPGESDDPRIRAMSTHRHRGFDIVLITQWPSKIHHQVRTLVGKHLHMNRALGLQRAGVFTWTRAQADPYDERERERAEEEIWAYDQSLYARYKSSTLHTATYKFKVPKKVWQAVSMVLVMGLVMWALWAFMFKPKVAERDEATDTAQVQAPNGAHAPPPVVGATVDEYLAMHQPRVDAMPWSAPLFDRREAISDPQVYCMASQAGEVADGGYRDGESCRCLTEQGTLYKLDRAQCLRVARWGMPYNPFRERRESDASRGAVEAEPVAAEAPGRPLPVFAGGEVGTGPQPAVDPTYGQLTRPSM